MQITVISMTIIIILEKKITDIFFSQLAFCPKLTQLNNALTVSFWKWHNKIFGLFSNIYYDFYLFFCFTQYVFISQALTVSLAKIAH